MREIKFRAWDKENHRVVEVLQIHPAIHMLMVATNAHPGYWINFTDSAILMQYTGLKDKNGVEIYEGDIVRGPSNTAVILESAAKSNRQIMADFEVRWSPHQFWGSWVLRPLTKVHRTYPAFKNCEVIGNIYENPELTPGKES